jgi:hypothetical protein
MDIRQAADDAKNKIVEAINRIKNAQVGYALSRVRQRFSQAVGLGAGETISINGQMPPSVVEALSKVGIDVSALEQLAERWNIIAELPDIAWDAILNNDGVMQQVRANLPRTDPPQVNAWSQNYLVFRSRVSETILGKYAIIKDEPLALMHRELGALLAWVAEVQTTNVLNIVNGNLTYARNELNSRVGQTMMMLQRMLGEIRTYIIAPRDEMIRQIATAIQEAYKLLQESIALNEGAIQEMNGILQEIQRTGQEVGVSGTTVAEILDGVRRRNAERREIIDRKLTELEGAVRTIAQSIGVGV